MASSVSEISRQVQESANIASQAVDQAHKTNNRVGELVKAAARIGDVVELINTIAGQTNLLALNATSELYCGGRRCRPRFCRGRFRVKATGGVQRQQVGLASDGIDQFDDVADPRRGFHQFADAVVGLVCLIDRLAGDIGGFLHLAAESR